MTHPVLRIFIVRHGETNENRAHIIQGQMDTLLNEEGLAQSQLCAEALKNIDFTVAFSSDLKRAVDTARIILTHHPGTALIEDPRLRERDMGELQGVRIGQYDHKKLPKSVETSELFRRRTMGWWKDVIEKHLPAAPQQPLLTNVLVVSHGAYIASLCQELVFRQTVEPAPGVTFLPCFNTSITSILMWGNKRGILERYADISHLVKPVVTTNADEDQAAAEGQDAVIT